MWHQMTENLSEPLCLSSRTLRKWILFVVGTEWVDPEDPTVIAENELLGAAAAIEAAAKKLEQLRPRTKPKVRGLFTERQQSH